MYVYGCVIISFQNFKNYLPHVWILKSWSGAHMICKIQTYENKTQEKCTMCWLCTQVITANSSGTFYRICRYSKICTVASIRTWKNGTRSEGIYNRIMCTLYKRVMDLLPLCATEVSRAICCCWFFSFVRIKMLDATIVDSSFCNFYLLYIYNSLRSGN